MPKREYSHSKLSTFENCPRKFDYRYVQRITRDTESIEAFLGKRVHEILERLHHHLARHGRPPSLRQVQDRYRQDWELHHHDKVEIVRDDRDVEFYRLQGDRCLENYYRKFYPFDEGEKVGIEQRVSIQLDDGGEYRARGIIDLVVRAGPGRYEIHDYKTGARMPSREKLASDRQLALYQIGLEQSLPDVEQVELVWHYLVFPKTVRVTRTEAELESLRSKTIQLIDRIEQTRDFEASPGPLCRWCEYRDICPEARLGNAARRPYETPRIPDSPAPSAARTGTPSRPEPATAGQQLSLL